MIGGLVTVPWASVVSVIVVAPPGKLAEAPVVGAVKVTEALAIAQKRGQTSIPPDQQPQSYALMRDTIQQMGGRIDRVLVNDATQREYLAQVVVSDGNGGEVKVIKARPGDAIALALQANAPIFVENQVLDRFGTKGSG